MSDELQRSGLFIRRTNKRKLEDERARWTVEPNAAAVNRYKNKFENEVATPVRRRSATSF